MVNIFGKRRPSRPSSFSAKSPGQKRGTAIVSRPGFRESGDCGPFSAASLGEYGATVQEWLEDEFMSGPGLAGRRSEPRWLGCGHNGPLSQITKFKSIRLFLGMFYKCRLDLRQTGMIFEENTLVYAILRCTRPLRETVHPRLTNYSSWA
jgi:hypothetical protein